MVTPPEKHAGENRATLARRKALYGNTRNHRPPKKGCVRKTICNWTPVTFITLHPIDRESPRTSAEKNPPALIHELARHRRCRRERLWERSGHLRGKVFASAEMADRTNVVLRILPDWVDS